MLKGRKTRITKATVSAVLSLLLLLTACSSGNTAAAPEAPAAPSAPAAPAAPQDNWVPEVTSLRVPTGSSSGMWIPQATIVAEHMKALIPGLDVSVMPGGGVDNVIAVGDGEVKLAMGYGNMVYLGYKGEPPFDQAYTNLKWIASIVPYSLSIIVKKDSGINSIPDLMDKKIAPGQKGFMSEEWFAAVINAYGFTYDDILAKGGTLNFVSYGEAAELMQDGHVDAIALFGAHPSGQALELSSQYDIKLLSIDDDVIAKLAELRPGTVKTTIPGAGVYGLGADEQANTVGGVYGFFTDDSLSDEMVYRITQAIYDSVPEMAKATHPEISELMNAANQRNGVPDEVPLHPGAMRWYEENK